MKIRQDVTDLLHAGHSDAAIGRMLHTDPRNVSAARAALGLPKHKRGKKPAESLQAAFLSHCEETSEGHMRWTGYVSSENLPGFRWKGRQWSARRAAYEIHHGTAPTSKTAPGCGQPDCVAPAHVIDLGAPGRTGAYNGPRPVAPVPDEAIVTLLRTGQSQSSIARQLRTSSPRVGELRERLGIPPHRPGTKPEPLDETFRRRAVPTEGGHLVWPTSDYHIKTVEGGSISAARYAFRQKYGRAPVGNVQAGCGTPRCVHPDHVEDQPMREALESQLAHIFGRSAA
ncbi:hypothetical protein PUR59_04355 [Streptomyces sp. SP18ES09]|uniref:hypothetical protein n=1 Tax=Streptomyces sp. SP18ES09 TaxID=3002532 RepID=UPI002E76EF0B|nr:hypothetical protein [Streptomyces sp. SP18ES09]MEE1814253.1 hypothetical protein [Streptomyces sp. SP18ES09]